MKKSQAIALFLGLFLFSLTQDQLHAQTNEQITISGKVVSAKNGKAVEGASIRISGARNEYFTNKNGDFTFNSNTNPGSLDIFLEGYKRLRLPLNNKSTIPKIVIHPINDPFINSNPKFEAVKVGEKVPDFEFALRNYHSPTAKISDFRGKLLILDFWTTSCTSCIYSFSKMEALQKKHGDKIQIILVNVEESEKHIKDKFKNRKNPIPQLETMPSVINNLAMYQLFPHHYAGNYFWIDPEGILRLSSAIDFNHTDEKINDVIQGKAITYIDAGIMKLEKSLTQLIQEPPNQYTELGTTFTKVHKDYIDVGAIVVGKIDTISNTLRNTYLNMTPLWFYYRANEEMLKKEWKTRVFGPNRGKLIYLDMFDLQVEDKTLYDKRFIPAGEETDINYIQSMFCYEQILPLNTSKEQANHIMGADLNRYLGLKYGTTFKIEEVVFPGYILKNISDAPVTEKEVRTQLKHLGKKEFRSTPYLESVIDNFYHPDYTKDVESWYPYVFDVDGVDQKREVIMPVWKEGDKLEDFVLALKANGLDYRKGEHTMKQIVVRDHQ